MDKKTFINQIGHLFRGQFLYAISQFLVLALLAKFGGDGESGKYVLALATTAPIFMFFDLNLRVIRATDHRYNEKFGTYLRLRSCCLCIAVVISLAICSIWFYDRIAIFLVVIAFRVGDSFSNLSFGTFQREKQSDLVGKTLTSKGGISMVAIGILIPLFGSAVVTGLAMATISLSWALSRDLPRAWSLSDPDEKLSWKSITSVASDRIAIFRIANRALPLGFDAFVSSLAFNSPKYVIEATMGTTALGIFGVLTQLAYSIQMLIGAVGHTGVGVLAEQKRDQKRAQFWRVFNRMLFTSLAVGAVAVVGGVIVIPPLFGYLLAPAYNAPVLVFVLLIASMLTGGQRTAGRGTQACGKYFIYTVFDVVTFAVSLVASLYFVHHYGLVGGGIALICAYGAGLAVTLIHTYGWLWPEEADAALNTS